MRVFEYGQLTDGILVKLKRKPFNMVIFRVYAPMLESTKEEIGKFYHTLENTKTKANPYHGGPKSIKW